MVLNPTYTFKNYLTTNSNAVIRNALLSAISLPGQIHNPLFIYGAVGVGKTHLLQAVVHEAIKDRLNFLRVKAGKSGLSLRHDIFKDIALNTESGFRELEGALARTKLYSSDMLTQEGGKVEILKA